MYGVVDPNEALVCNWVKYEDYGVLDINEGQDFKFAYIYYTSFDCGLARFK